MDPTIAALLAIGGVVATLGLAVWLYLLGSSSRDAEVSALKAELSRALDALEEERDRVLARAHGAREDFAREAELDAALRGGDPGGLLRQFPDGGAGAASSESRGAADEADRG